MIYVCFTVFAVENLFLKVAKACLSEQIKVHFFLQFSALDLVDKFLMKLN